ncbi:MAG: hypothetical protein Q8885_02125 [Candidatus Phytoplasma stylosanthis]|nr:hypothetical protein [Candidatus Phytoplasma stylosanthis]
MNLKNKFNFKNFQKYEFFFTKKNLKIFLISSFLIFIYTLLDVMFMSGDYEMKLYTTGIHGIGDAIAKVLIQIFPNILHNKSFNGYFVAFFFWIC